MVAEYKKCIGVFVMSIITQDYRRFIESVYMLCFIIPDYNKFMKNRPITGDCKEPNALNVSLIIPKNKNPKVFSKLVEWKHFLKT